MSNKKIKLCLALWLCVSVVQSLAQDYIITWGNDTLYCHMPSDVKKLGLRPFRQYEDGYSMFPAFFKEDSLGMVKAGDIKSYYREKHGKSYLCNGYFDSKQLQGSSNSSPKEVGALPHKTENWFFLRREVAGAFVWLYLYYEGPHDDYGAFYLCWPGQSFQTAQRILTRKHLMRLLADADISEELAKVENRKERRQFRTIVAAYNRVKARK